MGRKARRERRETRRRSEFLTVEQGEVQEALRAHNLPLFNGGRGQLVTAREIMQRQTAKVGQMTQVQSVGQAVQMTAAEKADLMRKYVDCVFTPIDLEALRKARSIVVAGNGVFEVRKTAVGVLVLKLASAKVDGFPDLSEGWHYGPERLPFALLAQCVAFFRWVKAEYRAEGLVRAYYDTVGGWRLFVPGQQVSGASAEVSQSMEDPTIADPSLGVWALEIHSHPGTSSVFSSIDDVDEVHERIYGCCGGVSDKDAVPNFHWRIGTGFRRWLNVETEDVVETGEPISLSCTPLQWLSAKLVFDPFQGATFPDEWKARVSEDRGGRVIYGPGSSRQVAGYHQSASRGRESAAPINGTDARLPMHYQGSEAGASFDGGITRGAVMEKIPTEFLTHNWSACPLALNQCQACAYQHSIIGDAMFGFGH